MVLPTNYHQNTAVAMETTSICEIPYGQLEQLNSTVPSIQKHVIKLLSKEINSDQKLIALLAGNSAHQRLASLLLEYLCSTGAAKALLNALSTADVARRDQQLSRYDGGDGEPCV